MDNNVEEREEVEADDEQDDSCIDGNGGGSDGANTRHDLPSYSFVRE